MLQMVMYSSDGLPESSKNGQGCFSCRTSGLIEDECLFALTADHLHCQIITSFIGLQCVDVYCNFCIE